MTGTRAARRQTKAQRRRAPAVETETSRRHVPEWLIPAVIVGATLVAFLPVLYNGFVTWDDDKNFIDNPHYRGLGLDQLRWMWTTFHMGHYVPLSWMTLGADYALWGMNPAGYHATSLALHVVNGILVYLLARRLFELATPAASENSQELVLAAGVTALLFALHPLRVESVAWATERRDVLSGVFFFASTLAYLSSRSETPSAKHYWLSLSLFVLALLSKATSMSLPAVLLLLNAYPLRRVGGERGWTSATVRRVYIEILPFALLSVATAILSIVALHPPPQLSFPQKIAVSAYSVWFYIGKTVAPTSLSPLYEMPRHVDPVAVRFVAGYVFCAVLAGVVWVLRRRRPGIAAALAAFILVTLPMLGVVQNGPQLAADRYTYHSAPALAMIGGAVFLFAARRSIATSLGVAMIASVALAALTWAQCEVWRDPERMWSRVVAVDAESSIGHSALANVRYRQNRVQDGIDESRRAVELKPELPEGYNGLGVGFARAGRPNEAIAEYQRALALKSTFDEAETNLGVSLAQLSEFDRAIEHYERALAINPDNSNAQVNWGNALVRMNRPDEAIRHYQEALRIRPENAEAHHNWGVALARQGKFAEAIEQFRATLALDPTHAEARDYLERASRILETRRNAPPVP